MVQTSIRTKLQRLVDAHIVADKEPLKSNLVKALSVRFEVLIATQLGIKNINCEEANSDLISTVRRWNFASLRPGRTVQIRFTVKLS